MSVYLSVCSGKTIHREEPPMLDNGGFAALELSSRHLTARNTFAKKNGARWVGAAGRGRGRRCPPAADLSLRAP